ncbi:MAG TPA: type II secretion system protein GspN [Smithella sp.]|nr:type II secretion system protein GspN [Smithella sp.]
MNILKEKSLWFILYGIFVTFVFLYLLFPSDIAISRLEEAANSSDLILKMDSLRPALPFGFKMKNINISSSPANIYFQGERLDLQFNPFSIFQKNKTIGLAGSAYGGNFSGRFGLASYSKIYPPEEGKLKFQNIDLAKYAFIRTWMGREVTGRASGIWTHAFNSSGPGRNLSGTIALSLIKGTYALTEPFLGLNKIDFDRGEINAQLKNGVIRLEKLQISGPQIDCFLSGEIALADDFKNSQLNLNGEMTLSEKKSVKMKITIGGTLINPVFRYI